MNFIERCDNLVKIAQFIRKEKTGTLEEIAQKCNLKKDAVHDHIEILRQFAARESAKILYDRDRRTYYFCPRGYFNGFDFITDD